MDLQRGDVQTVVLPAGALTAPPARHPAVLLSCCETDGPAEVLAALREHEGAVVVEAAVLAADVDGLRDMEAMREMLRQAQGALRRRQRLA